MLKRQNMGDKGSYNALTRQQKKKDSKGQPVAWAKYTQRSDQLGECPVRDHSQSLGDPPPISISIFSPDRFLGVSFTKGV